MKRDNSVTVTRESRVTETNAGVTLPVTNRVSHATTTTPHHTMFVLAVSCGVFGQSLHASHGDLGACDALAPLAGVIA